ncbi:unnamed protein product, partial [Ectocarpus sp. 4 AP-2014]
MHSRSFKGWERKFLEVREWSGYSFLFSKETGPAYAALFLLDRTSASSFPTRQRKRWGRRRTRWRMTRRRRRRRKTREEAAGSRAIGHRILKRKRQRHPQPGGSAGPAVPTARHADHPDNQGGSAGGVHLLPSLAPSSPPPAPVALPPAPTGEPHIVQSPDPAPRQQAPSPPPAAPEAPFSLSWHDVLGAVDDDDEPHAQAVPWAGVIDAPLMPAGPAPSRLDLSEVGPLNFAESPAESDKSHGGHQEGGTELTEKKRLKPPRAAIMSNKAGMTE